MKIIIDYMTNTFFSNLSGVNPAHIRTSFWSMVSFTLWSILHTRKTLMTIALFFALVIYAVWLGYVI